jgi:hypothetical protein
MLWVLCLHFKIGKNPSALSIGRSQGTFMLDQEELT